MVVFIDSFDHYNTAQFGRKYKAGGVGSNAVIDSAAGRFSTSGYRAVGSNVLNARIMVLLGGQTTIGWGAAMNFTNVVTSSSKTIFIITDNDGAIHVRINVNAAQFVEAYCNNTLLGASSSTVPLNTYGYMECKVTIHDTTGSVEVKWNGATILNLTNQDTRTASNGQAWALSINTDNSSSMGFDMDDLVIWDTTGATNNNFLGDVRIPALFATGAGNYTQWTPSAGSNYDNVNETPSNDDTDYNSTNTASNKDSFVFENSPIGSGTVYAVAVNLTARKDDAGNSSVRPLARLSSTDSFGTTSALGTTYTGYQSVFETKPGGGAWSTTDVNNAEFGYENV